VIEELEDFIDFLRGLGRDRRGYSLNTSQFGCILDIKLATFDQSSLWGIII